jgi:DNA-binding NarL/FixJ family response regulator
VGVGTKSVAKLLIVLEKAGAPTRVVIAKHDVVALGKIAPSLVLCDLDGLDVDPLEWLRQARFVLPGSIIIVYTNARSQSWLRACHSSGANGMLSKKSSESELVSGIRSSIRIGCFTDPNLAA